MVICLERGADLHMVQLMPLPLTVSCFSKIQIGFTFLVPAHPGSPGHRAVKRACVRACVCAGGCVSVLFSKCLVLFMLLTVSAVIVSHTHKHTILTVIFLVILLSFLYVLAYFSRLVVIITEVVILTLLASFISC